MTPAQVKKKFDELLRGDTIEDVSVAQDLLLETNTLLSEVSRVSSSTLGLARGAFVFEAGEAPFLPRRGVAWRAVRINGADRVFWAPKVIVWNQGILVVDTTQVAAISRMRQPDEEATIGAAIAESPAIGVCARFAWEAVKAMAGHRYNAEIRPRVIQAWIDLDARERKRLTHPRAEDDRLPIENPSRLVDNPAWVTKLLADAFVSLEEKIPAAWMPKLDQTKATKGNRMSAHLPDYGCGAYGCVLPTLDPKVVLKVTSDVSEAEFAHKLAQRLPTPICVNYYKVVHLPDKERKGNPIYLLWREEAQNVGKIDKVVGKKAEHAINEQHQAAKEAFVAHLEGRGDQALDQAWLRSLAGMRRIKDLAWLADGMEQAYRAGIFITDVHGGNLGQVQRHGKTVWAITDPGNVVVLD